MREAAGYTQRRLGEACGFSHAYLHKQETGATSIMNLERVRQVARVLDVDPRPLLVARALDKGMVETELLCDHDLVAALQAELGC